MAFVRLNGAEIARILDSPAGPAGLDLARRAERVQARAKMLVGYSAEPRDDSHLRDTIVKRWAVGGGEGRLTVLVGTAHPRALMHHEGTRPHIIVPRNARVLAWETPDGTRFAAEVHHPGTAPNRFLVNALPAAIE